ncbi:MAG: IS110 family transposase [Cohaesibacteraceae bacterium]|nr:IS110 family transposase [Cohaesibacteraceae bacterium]MBL4875516.1 IS110 family transposase [Cohaesibacteraceae bacterium]
MGNVNIIGIDLAKRVFQLHGAGAEGTVLFRKKLSRSQFLKFLSKQPNCIVAMEACSTSHYWGREIVKLGHEVRLIPPIYVKPFVKRQKNDTTDAEAIAEAAVRPTMRFVAVKTADQQSHAMVFRTRELLVGQRTQLINALRGHLAEHGIVAAVGIVHFGKLVNAIEDEELPEIVRTMSRMFVDQISICSQKISMLNKTIRTYAAADQGAALLQTMPGVGPISAMAIKAFAPSMEEFKSGRDFAAWLGLVPRQHSSGGKERLGRASKMGQRDIRRLLITGAMSVVQWAGRKGTTAGSWLDRMMARKPLMLVAIALANKMARMIWAMLTRNEIYRDPVMIAT